MARCPECDPLLEASYRWTDLAEKRRTVDLPEARRQATAEIGLAELGLALASDVVAQAEASLVAANNAVTDARTQMFEATGSLENAAAMTPDISFTPVPGWLEYDLGGGLKVWCRTEEAFELVAGALAVGGLQQALADALGAQAAAQERLQAANAWESRARDRYEATVDVWDAELDRITQSIEDAEARAADLLAQYDACREACREEIPRKAAAAAAGAALVVAGLIISATSGIFGESAEAAQVLSVAAPEIVVVPATSSPTTTRPPITTTTTTLPQPEPERLFSLGPEPLEAQATFTDSDGACNFPAEYTDLYIVSTRHVTQDGQTIVLINLEQPSTGDVVEGEIVADGTFTSLTGGDELYSNGRVEGDTLVADYQYTSGGCTQSWLATMTFPVEATTVTVPSPPTTTPPTPTTSTTSTTTPGGATEPPEGGAAPPTTTEIGGSTTGTPGSEGEPTNGGRLGAGLALTVVGAAVVATATTGRKEDKTAPKGTEAGEDEPTEEMTVDPSIFEEERRLLPTERRGEGEEPLQEESGTAAKEDDLAEADLKITGRVTFEGGTMRPPKKPMTREPPLTEPRIHIELSREPTRHLGGRSAKHIGRPEEFTITVEVPPSEDPPKTIEVSIETDKGEESLTLRSLGGGKEKVVYKSEPLSVELGGEGGTRWSLFGFEFRTGGFGPLPWRSAIDADPGDQVTVKYGEAEATFTVHEGWKQRLTAQFEDDIADSKRFWTNVKEALADAPDDDEVARSLRHTADVYIGFASRVEIELLTKPELTTTERLTMAQLGSELMHRRRGPGYEGSPSQFRKEAKKRATKFRESELRENVRMLRLAIYRGVVSQTPGPSTWMLFTGDDILADPNRPRKGKSWERALAAVEFAGWVTLNPKLSPGTMPRSRRPARPRQPRPTRPQPPPRTAPSPGRGRRAAPPGPEATRPRRAAPPGPEATRRRAQPEALTDGPEAHPVAVWLSLGRLRAHIPRIRRKRGYHDTAIHGTGLIFNRTLGRWVRPPSPFKTHFGNPVPLATVLRRIRRERGYRRGMPVRLLSCWSAANGGASQVAAALRTWVIAPSKRLWLDANGVLRHDPGGYWVLFNARGRAIAKHINGQWVPIP